MSTPVPESEPVVLCPECNHPVTPGQGHPEWPDTHVGCAVRAYMDWS